MRQRKTKIPKRLPKPTTSDAVAREYYRNIRKYSDAYCGLLREGLSQLIPGLKEVAAAEQPRMDSNIEERLRALFDQVEAILRRSYPDTLLRYWARHMVGLSNKHEKKNIIKMANAVDIDVEPLLHDRGLNPFFQNVIDENVGLIRSIPQEKMATFKNKLVLLLTNDASGKDIASAIEDHIGKKGNVRNRARLIAVDQVGKLNGRLNQYRQQQLGGTRYRWKGAMDERERKDHRHLQDTVQRWDRPPVVDRRTGRRAHPGGDYRCRCRAEMVISDILD